MIEWPCWGSSQRGHWPISLGVSGWCLRGKGALGFTAVHGRISVARHYMKIYAVCGKNLYFEGNLEICLRTYLTPVPLLNPFLVAC